MRLVRTSLQAACTHTLISPPSSMATVYPEYTELTAVSDREMYRPLNYPVEIHTGDAQKCRLHLKLILADAILSFITHILAGDMSRRSRSSLRVLTEYR